jgi:hypothetical protein
MREGERGETSMRPVEVKESGRQNNTNKRKKPVRENEPRKTRGVRPDYRKLNDPYSDESKSEDLVNAHDEEDLISEVLVAEIGDEFHSLREAKESPEWPEWEQAILTELNQHQEKGTWELVSKPADAVLLKNKWVFVRKRNKEGQIQTNKARLVVKGCGQRPGFDFVETYSPVVRLESIRAILAIAVTKRLKIQQMDVKGAYLNGVLKETLYMHQPEGFEDGSGRVCHLIRTLYGLKQSGREWNAEFDTKMKLHGYKRLRADPCVYTRSKENKTAIITVWVDDLLLFADSEETMDDIKNDIRSEWETKDLGEPSKIVGIEISQSPGQISISQRQNIQKILERQGLDDACSVQMPLDPKVIIRVNPEGNEGNQSNAYAQLLGELQFISNATRPDIAFAVNSLACYTPNPSMQHQTALKRILRYLAGTKAHGITYKHVPESPPTFKGFADAAFKNRDKDKSTTGYVFIAAGGAITWKSAKQSVTSTSTTEAEYIALWDAGKETSWLRNLYHELGYTQQKPTTIMQDNNGTYDIAKNPVFHKRTKHIDSKFHWVREKIQEGRFDAELCRSDDQTADVLTKALTRPLHEQHTEGMGVSTV